MAKRFITIAGNIGSGKTTLTNLLAERYGWEPYYESVTDNPYLADFYDDMPRWSFPLQMFFLAKRFQAHQKITASDGSAIQDRSIYEDAHIFARALKEAGHLDERDHSNYCDMFSTMTEFLTPPDLVIYVRRSVPCLVSRIRERGRHYEKDIPTVYLEQLNRCYDDWISNYRLGKVLTVEADDLDLKWKKEHLDYVCERMENSLEQPELIFTC